MTELDELTKLINGLNFKQMRKTCPPTLNTIPTNVFMVNKLDQWAHSLNVSFWSIYDG